MPKRRRIEGTAVEAYVSVLKEMQKDLRAGNLQKVGYYQEKYGIARFNRLFIVGLGTEDGESVIRDRACLILEFNRNRSFRQSLRSKNGELFDENLENQNIEQAIELLKSRGYRILKQKVEYEEI